jgi:tRNA threonylcarbamoyladenosine biosynthesis protein TsaE
MLMINFEYISHSPEETMNFASELAKKLNVGDVIVLNGDLGSGKTKFTEGMLKYFGLQDEISSPTFTIVNEYNAKNLNIYHFDVYRFSDSSEFYAIGGEDYFSQGLCIIEWGTIISDALPNEYIEINFEKSTENDDYRLLKIHTLGNKYDNLFE